VPFAKCCQGKQTDGIGQSFRTNKRDKNAYRILAGIAESKRILVDPEEDGNNIKMDLT
jgi:hypothetical protein